MRLAVQSSLAVSRVDCRAAMIKMREEGRRNFRGEMKLRLTVGSKLG